MCRLRFCRDRLSVNSRGWVLRLGNHDLALEIGEHGFLQSDFGGSFDKAHLVDLVL